MWETAETAIKNVGVEALAGWSRGFSRCGIPAKASTPIPLLL